MKVVVEGDGFRIVWDPIAEVWGTDDIASTEALLAAPPTELLFSPTFTPEPDYSRGEDLVNRLAVVGIKASIVEPPEPPPVEWEPDVIY